MTDLEMTRLCAEAMGFKPPQESIGGLPWRPLIHDVQAMALVKRFEMRVGFYPEVESWSAAISTGKNSSWCANRGDLNRAIVECVAKMQQAKA